MVSSSLSIVLPAYNEEARLGPALDELFAYLRSVPVGTLPDKVDVFVVDDGSADGTAALVRATFGDSRFAIRLLPAIAAAATVWIGVLLVREFGGGRFARALAGLSLLTMPGLIGTCSILSMNAFDVFCWAACALVVTRILRGGDQRLWILFGLLAGLGLENKISVLFLGAYANSFRRIAGS